jgi:putative heme-binding domain-containing protein
VLEAIAAGLQQDLPQVRLAALEVLREVPAPETLSQVRHMVDDDPDPEVRLQAIRLLTDLKDTKIVPSLLRLAIDSTTSNQLRQAAIRAVVAIDAKPYGRQLAEIALAENSPVPLVEIALDALAIMGSEEAKQAIEKRLGDPRAVLRVNAIEACIQVHGDDAAARIIPKLHDPDVSVQQSAISALSTLVAASDSKSRIDVIKALAAVPDRRALPIYLGLLLDEDQGIREASRGTLLALGDSICGDLRTLHKRNELATPVRRALGKVFSANSQFDFLDEDAPAELGPSVYAQFAADHRGDPHRGQKLFVDTEGIDCSKCHVVGGAGTANIGPDLLGIGAKYPRHELIRSVLEPSNRILIDFETVIVETISGRIHQGMVRSQTPERIELVTPEGEVIPIRANEIELKETSSLSPMPDGLVRGVTLQDFADIIAYLESLKQPFSPAAK